MYREWESNPHGPYGPTDFKSVLSTYSNITASFYYINMSKTYHFIYN